MSRPRTVSPSCWTSWRPNSITLLLRRPHNNNKNTIICLQEVSYDWAGALHTFFANRGYHLVTGLYGKPFNGYMGVALAWPTDTYEAVDVDICRLADTREDGWPRPNEGDENEGLTTVLTKWTAGLVQRASSVWDRTIRKWGLAGSPKNEDETPPDHWSLSERRFNVLLTATLREKGTSSNDNTASSSFCISNYHMPCAYYCPMAMTLHADLCARRLQSIAERQGQLPYILAYVSRFMHGTTVLLHMCGSGSGGADGVAFSWIANPRSESESHSLFWTVPTHSSLSSAAAAGVFSIFLLAQWAISISNLTSPYTSS
jgi:hypothetical protein